MANTAYNIAFKQSPNYKKGTGIKKIGICNHKTAGRFPGCLNWMMNPNSDASAQYLVTRKGEIIQLVKDEDIAYHAGVVHNPTWSLYSGINPNKLLIGIEHEDYDGDGELGLTEPQYQATLWLHRLLITRYGFPIDREHIIGHNRIDSVNRPNCPGQNFPFDRLFMDLLYPPISVYYKGKCIKGFIGNGNTLVPLRELCSMMGWTLKWDGATNTVLINSLISAKKTDYIKIVVGNVQIVAMMFGNVSYGPVRKICETLGYKIDVSRFNNGNITIID